MKFLHTADIHLKKGDEKRLQVLEWMIEKADQKKIDYFIIAGDLFDSDTDAIELRPVVKSIFERAKTQFLIIPGNHDSGSYDQTHDYGQNVIQFHKSPFEIMEKQNMIICAVPYQNKRFSECVKNIPTKIDLLLCHGTLYDESFIYSMLEDEETMYMPIFPGNLENISRYVALGHLHTRAIEKKYKNTHVVYPGSPVAIDTKCAEKRFCYIITLDTNKLEIESLEIEISPYWAKKDFFVFPGNEDTLLANIETYINGLRGQRVMPDITVQGYIAENDRAFNEKIMLFKNKYADDFEELNIESEISSWGMIMQNQMVRNFVRKTSEFDNDLRMKIFEIIFPIFSKTLK
ncbi:MAG: DNA repair exonuclease [bacterium]